MKLPVATLSVGFALLSITPSFNAQDPPPNSQTDKGRVEIKELSAPVYPPLARQTRISGDVHLIVKLLKDGGLASVEGVSGHLLLQQAAIESAKKGKFGCVDCTDSGASQELVYTFVLKGDGDCCPASNGASTGSTPETLPRSELSENHIIVVDQPVCYCDVGPDHHKVRSIKCLYLWHCGIRWGS